MKLIKRRPKTWLPYIPYAPPTPTRPADWMPNKVTSTMLIVQPKLNGVRALLSPDGRVYKKSSLRCHHLDNQFDAYGHWIDGELWHSELDLGTIAGLVNRTESDEETRTLKFVAFDLIHPDIPQIERLAMLAVLAADKLDVIEHAVLTDPLDATARYKECISNTAFDGMIYRDIEAGYQFGVTDKVLKRKRLLDAEYLCTGVTEGMGKFFGMLGSFQLVMSDGTEFSCGGGALDVKMRKQLWKDPPIGKMLQVEYPYVSADGIPQCPQFVRIRENKDI